MKATIRAYQQNNNSLTLVFGIDNGAFYTIQGPEFDVAKLQPEWFLEAAVTKYRFTPVRSEAMSNTAEIKAYALSLLAELEPAASLL